MLSWVGTMQYLIIELILLDKFGCKYRFDIFNYFLVSKLQAAQHFCEKGCVRCLIKCVLAYQLVLDYSNW